MAVRQVTWPRTELRDQETHRPTRRLGPCLWLPRSGWARHRTEEDNRGPVRLHGIADGVLGPGGERVGAFRADGVQPGSECRVSETVPDELARLGDADVDGVVIVIVLVGPVLCPVGRVVRHGSTIAKIVEFRDATAAERAIDALYA